MTQQVFGKDLNVGDVIETWWRPNRDTILALRPYNGPLSYLFPQGARLATFAMNKSGMTVDNGDQFKRIA